MRKQDVTYQDKLNELRLDISHPNSKGLTFILVEGDTDVKLFRKFFELAYCKVENIPGGKSKVEECVIELLKKYNLVFGIRDADFTHLNKILYNKQNVFLTDHHDIEMTLVFETSVLNAVLFEVLGLEQDKHLIARDIIINLLKPISLLRWLNDIEDLRFNFEFGFQDIINFNNQENFFKDYFDRLISNSPNAKIKDREIIKIKLESLDNPGLAVEQLVNGHDFMKTLARYAIHTGKSKSINEDIVAGYFRTAFSLDDFAKTELYKSTSKWAETNSCIVYRVGTL